VPSFHNYLFDAGQHGPGPHPMPSAVMFSAHGATTPVIVSVPPAVENYLNNAGQPVPPPSAGLSLVDTGASQTCVHEPVLKALGLQPSGTIQSGTAAGPVTTSLYFIRLALPGLMWVGDLQVVGVDLSGQSLPTDPPQDIVGLIGRNLLQNWTLIWNGVGGHWSIST